MHLEPARQPGAGRPSRPSRLARATALCCLLLSTACGESASGLDAGPPSLELGTGSASFEPLVDGDTILIVRGPQGGFHFYGSMRASNINPGDPNDLSDPNNPQTSFEVFVGDLRVDAMASSYKQGLRPGVGGVEMIGRTVILDIQDDAELAGTEVLFRVSLSDAEGVMLSDERTLTAQADPNNP